MKSYVDHFAVGICYGATEKPPRFFVAVGTAQFVQLFIPLSDLYVCVSDVALAEDCVTLSTATECHRTLHFLVF